VTGPLLRYAQTDMWHQSSRVRLIGNLVSGNGVSAVGDSAITVRAVGAMAGGSCRVRRSGNGSWARRGRLWAHAGGVAYVLAGLMAVSVAPAGGAVRPARARLNGPGAAQALARLLPDRSLPPGGWGRMAGGPGPGAGLAPLGPGVMGRGWGPGVFDRASGLAASGGGQWLPARTPAAAGSRWRVQPTPNPAMRNGTLYAATCAGPAACTAVGDYENAFGSELAMAQRWSGTGWLIQPTPSPRGAIYTLLAGVSCPSAAACTAVGYYFNRGGTRILPLAERWNGSRWAGQPVPGLAGYQNDGLFAVSCTSPRDCTAAGAAFTSGGRLVTLAERWNGARWTVQPTPGLAGGGSQLTALSCTSPRACTAVGDSVTSTGTQVTLAERWNGSRWTTQAVPNPVGSFAAGLSGVSCSALRACTAVGFYAPGSAPPGVTDVLAEYWNGTSWRIQRAPSPPPPVGVHSGSYLSAVSCTSPRACAAVGSYTGTVPLGLRTLAERWNGSRWAIQRTPTPASGGTLSAISCSSPGACVAAGSSVVQQPIAIVPGFPVPTRTLAEAWTAGSWRIRATADRLGAAVFDELNAVSCTSARACTAAGDYLNGAGTFATLAERWNGTRWAIQPIPTPRPARAFETALNDVSCSSARACTAAGSYSNATSPARTLAEQWNGTRWRIEKTPNPGGTLGSFLFGVSCPSARTCTAVGSAGKGAPLAQRWNGRRWAVQPTPRPRGTAAELAGVSCASASACTAVGDYIRSAGKSLALAERWDGRRWAVHPVPAPTGAMSAQLSSVSCVSASACTAVGSYTGKSGQRRALAERWNGSHWAVQPTSGPAGSASAVLTAVSCSARRACTASGVYFNSIGANLALTATWDGSHWTMPATSPNPASAFDSELSGVSCLSARACTATGSYLALTNATVTLAVTDQATPVP
jgi:hypothetical protein